MLTIQEAIAMLSFAFLRRGLEDFVATDFAIERDLITLFRRGIIPIYLCHVQKARVCRVSV